MTVQESIKQQLDAGKRRVKPDEMFFVSMSSKDFCDLVRPLNPSEDSDDDVEVSMAKTCKMMDGKHVETLYANNHVAQRLIDSTSPQRVAPKADKE